MRDSYSVDCPKCGCSSYVSNPQPEDIVTSVKADETGGTTVLGACTLGLTLLFTAAVEVRCPSCNHAYEARFNYRIS